MSYFDSFGGSVEVGLVMLDKSVRFLVGRGFSVFEASEPKDTPTANPSKNQNFIFRRSNSNKYAAILQRKNPTPGRS